MQAAVVRELNQPVSIEDIHIDDPEPYEVVVRTVAAGVCHSDMSAIDGTVTIFPRPLVLGHESAGIVERVGSAVTYVEPGDHVVTCLGMFCGHCEPCLRGRSHLCEGLGELLRGPNESPRLSADGEPLAQFAGLGSFAEQILVHQNAVAKVPREMPLDRASLLGCGITTGIGSVLNTANVPFGSSVAVIGCGGVGLGAVQGARMCGAARIIAIDKFPNRLELAKEMGATDLIDASAGDSVARVMELTRTGVDYSFEAVGTKATCGEAFRMLKPGGVATVVGVVLGMTLELDGDTLMAGRSIIGSRGGSSMWRLDIPRYADFYMQGRLKLDELVTGHMPLDRLNEAFDSMSRGEGARTVITF